MHFYVQVQFFLSESEQSSTESRVLDGAQNLEVSSGNNKDEQVQFFLLLVIWFISALEVL